MVGFVAQHCSESAIVCQRLMNASPPSFFLVNEFYGRFIANNVRQKGLFRYNSTDLTESRDGGIYGKSGK